MHTHTHTQDRTEQAQCAVLAGLLAGVKSAVQIANNTRNYWTRSSSFSAALEQYIADSLNHTSVLI